MKKIIKKIVIISILLWPIQGKALSIVGLGDSITTGYGAEKGYFSVLCETYVKKEKATCQNLAINGLTTEGLLKQLEDPTVKKNIQTADIIFISIGGNDFLRELSKNIGLYISTSSGNIETVGKDLLQNVEQIYTKVYKIHKDVNLYAVPLYNPYYRILSRNEKAIEAFHKIQDGFIKVSKDYHVKVDASLSHEMEDPSYLNTSMTNLDPHPNQKGHEKIANSFYNLMNPKKEKSVSIPFKYFLLIPLIFAIILWFQKRRYLKF